jgi:hypothetical protein
MHGEASAGEVEQAVPLQTVQDISELDETGIIGVHRNFKPFRAKRMDWRAFPHLVQLTTKPPPPLPILPEPPEIPPLAVKSTIAFPECIDPDGTH